MPHDTMLAWLHFGDLHLTLPGEANHRDFAALVEQANAGFGALDFALLPGDSAEDGTEAQFRLVRAIAGRLTLPLRILPGDHDIKPGSLAAYHAVLGAPGPQRANVLPRAEVVRGHRCLYLDIVSAGTGGPDFRLDTASLDWLAGALDAAEAAGETAVLFMHAYPADLQVGRAELLALLAAYPVACVDMGHTHYNELSNDGRTIYAATRSIGQVEEGPPGVSVAAVDGGAVSWGFRPLGAPWPMVLITAPADERLRTVLSPPPTRLRALVLGPDAPRAVTAEIDGAAAPMARAGRAWSLELPTLAPGPHRVVVRAETVLGAGEDAIDIVVGPPAGRSSAAAARTAACRAADGSDADRLGAWPARHILGTQLGPNRNGRKW